MGSFSDLFGTQTADNTASGVAAANGLLAGNQAANAGLLNQTYGNGLGALTGNTGSALAALEQGHGTADGDLTSNLNQSLLGIN